MNESHIVTKNLIDIEEEDYEIYHELYENVMQKIITMVVHEKRDFWNIEFNDIRNYSDIFNLSEFFIQSKYNTLLIENFEDKYMYRIAVENLYINLFIEDLVNRLKKLPQDDALAKFIAEAEEHLYSKERQR